MVREAHVVKIQVVKEVGTGGRMKYSCLSLSSPSFAHPITLWFIGVGGFIGKALWFLF